MKLAVFKPNNFCIVKAPVNPEVSQILTWLNFMAQESVHDIIYEARMPRLVTDGNSNTTKVYWNTMLDADAFCDDELLYESWDADFDGVLTIDETNYIMSQADKIIATVNHALRNQEAERMARIAIFA